MKLLNGQVVPQLVLDLACYAGSFVIEDNLVKPRRNLLSRFTYRSGLLFLKIAADLWLATVNIEVPEPYLDEVFHIPQAEKYLQGKWTEWDDKITTPPGLYLISQVFLRLWALTPSWASAPFSTQTSPELSVASLLRATNVYAVLAIVVLASKCRKLIEARRGGSGNGRAPQLTSFYSLHTAFNIALFPVIFFFSGLYYTDLWSTAAILWAYRNHLVRMAGKVTFWNDLNTVLLGVAALWMRQTNVFWVVVYFGGLEAVHAVKTLASRGTDRPVLDVTALEDTVSVAKAYWNLYASGNIHDPPVSEATFYDIAWLVISLAVAAINNLPRVLRRVWPHISIMALFAAFVVWNGGVVLGDKSNHVATLHLAQLLYIWPLFAFFSAPLMLSCLVSAAVHLRDMCRGRPAQPSRGSDAPRPPKARVLQILGLVRRWTGTGFPFPLWYVSLALAVAVVHKSTIIHPFTLADNRHYMFYVFRYTILRRPEVRYMLVPFYVVCHRLCWQLLGGAGSSSQPAAFVQAPGAAVEPRPAVEAQKERGAKAVEKDEAAAAAAAEGHRPECEGDSLSTAVLWLLATALSLMTAPLVEPRYFIVPWVLWRLLVPAWRAQELRSEAGGGGARTLYSLQQRLDLRLVLETLWFIAINLGTMYMFIARPYHWRDVDGKLMDEGRLQRFMW